VTAEAQDPLDGRESAPPGAPEDPWERDLTEALKRHPELRPVVILPLEGAALKPRALAVGVRSVLVRPFFIRALKRALASAADGGSMTVPRPAT
jgi:hypothetical protein